MKKIILLLIILPALVFTANAQLGFNYSQYSLGLGIGYYKAKTDVPNQHGYPSYNFNASYNFTPYTRFSIEYGFGKLSGGFGDYYKDAVKSLKTDDANAELLIPFVYAATVDPYVRSYTNNYQSVALHADVQLGEFIDYSSGSLIPNIVKNIYVGTGVGVLYNKISSISRLSIDDTYSYGVKDRSSNVMVPVRAGYQFKFYDAYDEPFITAELGYQMNYVFGYGIDGYTDPLFTNRDFERYGGFHLGIKFNFGDYTSYRKSIR